MIFRAKDTDMRLARRFGFAMLVAALAVPGAALAGIAYPTNVAGTFADAAVNLQCDASGLNCQPVTATNPVPVTAPNALPATATGNVASGSTDSGNPVKVGGVGSNNPPTAVTAGQRTNLWTGLNGNTIVGGIATTGTDTGTNTEVWIPDSLNGTARTLAVSPYFWDGTNKARLRGDTNGLVVQPGLSATFWSYTSGVTPILSNTTTAVTIKAAAGASVRNYIDSCQLTTTAFGASVPLALRDGAGGTVKFALTVPTGGFLQPVIVNFSPPLQGTANTLWEVATPTPNTSGTVTINCAGHTG